MPTKKKRKTAYWSRVLQQAAKRQAAGKPAFTANEIERAGDWVTCACGKQDKRIPRYEGEPRDGLIRLLGYRFGHDVEMGCVNEAKRNLARIEARAAVLIAEIERGAR